MQYKFERSVFNNPRVYDTVIHTMLIGYAKNVTRLSEDALNGSQFDTNVILYGVTEASAKIRASDTFKGTNYVNIRCVGSDTELDDLRAALDKNRFNGHVIICPEVEHARDHVYYHLACMLNIVGYDMDYRKGRYNRDFHTLIPNTSVENDLLWAMFDNWKFKQFGSHRNILIENAEHRFIKYWPKADDFLIRQRTMARDVAPKKLPDDASEHDPLEFMGPHELDPVKTYVAFLDRTKCFDTNNLHPVRIGRDFRHVRLSYLREIIDDLSPYGVSLLCAEDDKHKQARMVCLDDYIAWKMFENVIETCVMYPEEFQTGSRGEVSGCNTNEPQTVYMEDIEKDAAE